MTDREKILEFNDVCFAYESSEVLHNISLEVGSRDFIAVIGPNGGGKSTLMKLALGLLEPDRGQVLLWGKKPGEQSKRIGYVPQHLDFDVKFPVSCMDVVLMGRVERHWFGKYSRKDKEAALKALEYVQLADFAKRSFAGISGGERQRVLIAQAIVSQPEFLILDEPTANVDSQTESAIYELLNDLNKDIPVMSVSHNLNVVTRHATHIVCVNHSASIQAVEEIDEHSFHALANGNMNVILHEEDCFVLDSEPALKAPHKGQQCTCGRHKK